MNRHGLARTVLGWIIACDTPRSAERPERNPGGWFTRFATSDRPWDLSRNLRQLIQAAKRSPTPPVAPPAVPATSEPDDEPGEFDAATVASKDGHRP